MSIENILTKLAEAIEGNTQALQELAKANIHVGTVTSAPSETKTEGETEKAETEKAETKAPAKKAPAKKAPAKKAPAKKAEPEPEENESPSEQEYTIDDVRQALTEASEVDGLAPRKILRSLGASRLSELKADNYADAIEAADAVVIKGAGS